MNTLKIVKDLLIQNSAFRLVEKITKSSMPSEQQINLEWRHITVGLYRLCLLLCYLIVSVTPEANP